MASAIDAPYEGSRLAEILPEEVKKAPIKTLFAVCGFSPRHLKILKLRRFSDGNQNKNDFVIKLVRESLPHSNFCWKSFGLL